MPQLTQHPQANYQRTLLEPPYTYSVDLFEGQFTTRPVEMSAASSVLLGHLAVGLTLNEAATVMHANPETVRNYRNDLYESLDTTSASQSITKAFANGALMIKRPIEPEHFPITTRCLRALECAAAGLTAEETALALNFGLEAIKSRRVKIFRETPANNIPSAVMMAIMTRQIDPEAVAKRPKFAAFL